MKRTLLLALAVAMIFSWGLSSPVSAQGFHFQSRNLHLDVGRPHRYYGGYQTGYRGHWGGHYGGGHHWGHDHVWHDTTHLDYHPGEFVPHYNHYHYVPGHWDVHYDGHWDHLHH